jgi:peroxiredoxin
VPGETTQCDLTIGRRLDVDAEAEDHLFSAYGTVADNAGRPIEGVQLWADCGHDKLQRTGRAVTDENGRYTLALTSSIKNVGADPYDVGIQTARIEARAKGYYEINLCRHGYLAMSGKPPTADEQRFVADYADVVLPHKPYELNFIMHPAAQIEGEYVNERGRPIRVRTVWLHGDGLLSNTTLSGFSGGNGKFTIDHIPCGSVWFRDFDKQFIDTRTLNLPRPGGYRLRLQSGKSPTGRTTLRITEFQPPAFGLAESDRRTVVDPNGNPVAGAQVALCTSNKGVIVRAGKLVTNTIGGRTTTIAETDADGLFDFSGWPDDFHLVAAHDKGFAWVTKEQFVSPPEIRLQSWGRIEGRLYIGRDSGADEKVALMNYINKNAIDQGVRYDYETRTDARGDFAFEKVPPGWLEIGYITQMGRSSWSYTNRTPVQIKPGRTFRLPLGGSGRPVIGRFVAPPGYEKQVYFGAGLRALDTVRPERPKPEDYDRMSKRQQQDWYNQWRKTPEAEVFYDNMWHDPGRRQYVFHIEPDGMFRIDDVIAGRYKFTVWIEEQFRGGGRPEEIASYYGALDVPEMPGGRSDEPLDVGELVLTMHEEPVRVGDIAPPFEAKTLDGDDLKLIDYRGRFVLLSFWQPVFHPEIEQLRELYDTYHPGGRLEIIGLGGQDTLEEVTKYVEENDIPWPQIYTGEDSKSAIAKEYALPGMPWIFLIDPDGKIIAKNLRGEKLRSAVLKALVSEIGRRADSPDPNGLVGRVLDDNGEPAAGAQVAISAEGMGVIISHGLLRPMLRDDMASEIVRTDSDGAFAFEKRPPEHFDLIVAHEKGFVLVESEEFLRSNEIKLQPWGRLEGRLAKNRMAYRNRISLSMLGALDVVHDRRRYLYYAQCDANGHFVFEKVPPDLCGVGYRIATGTSGSSDTCVTPVEVKAGQTAHVTLGGAGRPVVGRFVPPAGHDKPASFAVGVRSLDMVDPELPLPDNFDLMTRRQQRQWREQWLKTDEFKKYRDAHFNKNWRSYSFRIDDDGSFRVEDVIAGKYRLDAIVEEPDVGQDWLEEIASYYGTVEVPQMPSGRSDEPLDLGERELTMREPLRVGDVAPLFEARTLGGEDLKLIDYRGRFVLLSFWDPRYHSEREHLQQLYDTYGPDGRLAIIGLGGNDTLEEIKKHVEQNGILWPQIFTGRGPESRIAKDYKRPAVPSALLIGPDGKIVAKLHGEELKSAVRKALEATNEHNPAER